MCVNEWEGKKLPCFFFLSLSLSVCVCVCLCVCMYYDDTDISLCIYTCVSCSQLCPLQLSRSRRPAT